jgi:hypothetical protein
MPERAKRVNGLHLPLTPGAMDVVYTGSRTRERVAGSRTHESMAARRTHEHMAREHVTPAKGGAACPAGST